MQAASEELVAISKGVRSTKIGSESGAVSTAMTNESGSEVSEDESEWSKDAPRVEER